MKCKVLLLSHAKLAEAFYKTIEFIYGDTTGFGYINMPEDNDQQQYMSDIQQVIEENKETGVLVLTDLFGGSPFLTCCKLLKNYYDQMEVLTGYNMSMLLEIASNMDEDISELKNIALNSGSKGIVDVKERMAK